ncbi:hypothetical protein [Saccharothrix hoggarensis]|uniref:PepSY domain-containing protein n=1 Tax=Saccharothrix hoggarensis TaxID=913853 RepID=A0ABW3QI91_9PSEU
MIPPPAPEPSFDLADLVGNPPDAAVPRLEAEGFDVQVVNQDETSFVTLDWRPTRIRLFTRAGVVVEARQG